jgi:hypothetical protein
VTAHPIKWFAPRPLWQGLSGSAVRKPVILRFAGDDFMEQLLSVLADDPALLGERVAAPETWRDGPAKHAVTPRPPRLPLPGLMRQARLKRALAAAPAAITPTPATKLYQPAHGRYYVAVASLACAIPGLPERVFTPGGTEAVGFVLRRLLPASAQGREGPLAEFAWTPGPMGPRWLLVARQGESAERLSPGEELLPLFPLAHGDVTGSRTLWGGLVPVGRREEYFSATIDRTPVDLAAAQESALRSTANPAAAVATGARITARLTRFRSEVAEPWKALIRSCHLAAAGVREDTPGSTETQVTKQLRARQLNLGWVSQSWLVLLDFADWLNDNLPAVMNALSDGVRPTREAEARLYDRLLELDPPASLATMLPGKPMLGTLQEALLLIRDFGPGLENARIIYAQGHQSEEGLPNWHFPLVAIDSSLTFSGASVHFTDLDSVPADDPDVEAEPSASASSAYLAAAAAAETLDRLTVLIARALTPREEADDPPQPFAQTLRNAMQQAAGDPGRFVLRFVHVNADCGPIHPPTLSEPTDPFALAHFFDNEAPARPVRITLPLDTSAAGLRKYPRNTAFVMSDMLCGQVQRAKGLGLGDLIRQVLPFPLHKPLDMGDGGGCKSGGVDIGMICSLSIPIITICALILLMVIVSLLDFIFRWIPYFIMCFPLPGLKGKDS